MAKDTGTGSLLSTPRTVNVTPSWVAIGGLFWRLAQSKELKALEASRVEFFRGYALAEALTRLHPALTEDQQRAIDETVSAELKRAGIELEG